MDKTLSVIVPVYNTEEYLERALKSILGQTYPVYEVICVDDGSTDGSLDILSKYAKKDTRIKVIHKENGGLVSARKAGILKARGFYAAYVDSDDFIEPEMYHEMMSLAVKYEADLVTSGLIRDYGTSITVESETIEAGNYSDDGIEKKILSVLVDQHRFYKANLSPHIVNMIFRTDILKKVQLDVDDRICVGEDDAVLYPFLFRSNRIVVSGKNFYHYCIRESGSIMGGRKEDDCESVQLLFGHLEREFRQADRPGIDLVKQFEILKTYFLLLRFPEKIFKFDGDILYPFGRIRKEDRLLLYGAGKFGAAAKGFLERQGVRVVGWVDKSAGRPGVIRPKEIHKMKFDCVLIAVLVADVAEQIQEDLRGMGIAQEKLLFADAEMIMRGQP